MKNASIVNSGFTKRHFPHQNEKNLYYYKSVDYVLINRCVDNFFKKNFIKSGELWGKCVYLHILLKKNKFERL